ncbi:tripartite tricarboxylate transporter substrate binding protein [Chelativorans sp. AA-79]|uniref:Bug family tripartite tricarboxylate transporter substrate binding protein n=1 Tax=Chelativorans sp. AA-79 TaxID=3028735 RepID=UPI0023F930AE|nr:tripartite tricarboxylate transporter substrate binding protein [Chelativorans sp. AA-79]WEX10917.1 tripartite tricarboxylate transporter substrate binding protein [Chelativorans sp. AA-79]
MKQLAAVLTAVVALALSISTPVAQEQQPYPVDTVTIVVPYAAGGTGDTVGRIVAEELSKRFTANFVVENVGGASGTIGAERVARAAPDGSVLLLAGNAIITTAPHLAPVGFDPLTDLVAIANISEAPRMLVASKSLPVSNFEEFVAYAREHPGELNFGSVGVGSTGHIATVDMLANIGVEANHIPYSGASQVVQAVLAGDVQFMLDAAAIPQARQDAVTPLAVPGDKRFDDFPDVPTLAEVGYPSIRGTGLQMIMGPGGMPEEIITLLERALQDASNSPEFTRLLVRSGVTPRFMSASSLKDALEVEHQNYDQLLTKMGLKQ